MEIKSTRSIVIFEIDDSNRQKESYSDNNYVELFVDFIRSLGFLVEYRFPDTKQLSSRMIVEGIELEFDYSKASYLSKNIYTRDWSPRKDRWIAISVGYNSNEIRIRFNTEMDSKDIKRRIQKMIDERKNIINEHENADLKKTSMIMAVKEYLAKMPFAALVTSFIIDEGMISLHLKNIGSLELTEDGKIKTFFIEQSKITSLEGLDNQGKFVDTTISTIKEILSSIQTLGWIEIEGYKEWAKSANRVSSTIS